MRSLLREHVIRLACVPIIFLRHKIERLNQPQQFDHESDGLY